MKAEEIVKAKWPDAHCAPYANPNYPKFYCIRGTRKEWALTLGEGPTPEKAWQDATRTPQAEEEKDGSTT